MNFTGEVRENLEGPTQVDALLLNRDNGFAVLFEAKVLSDISHSVTFDPLRNQLARNIDVMLEPGSSSPPILRTRKRERSLFVLITPKLFQDNPESRLYGHLLHAYRERNLLERHLPHREPSDCEDARDRIGWITWEDCQDVHADACLWL